MQAMISDDLDAVLAEAAAGGLPRAEQLRVAELLRRDPTARARYAEYRLAVQGAAHSALTPMAAPAHLAGALRKRVQAEARVAPAKPLPWWQTLFNKPALGWAVAALALLLGLGGLNLNLLGRVNGQQAALAAAQARQATINDILTSPALINVALAGDVSGRLLCAPDKPGILSLSGLQPGRRYEIQLTRNSIAEPHGTFSAESDGSAQIIVDTLPWQQYAQIDVLDPAAGRTSVSRGVIVYRERG